MTCCVASHSKDIYQSPAVGQGLLYSGFHSGPAHLAPFHLKCYRTFQPRDPSAGSSPATQAADLNSYPIGPCANISSFTQPKGSHYTAPNKCPNLCPMLCRAVSLNRLRSIFREPIAHSRTFVLSSEGLRAGAACPRTLGRSYMTVLT